MEFAKNTLEYLLGLPTSPNRTHTLRICMAAAKRPGDWAEFGVHSGGTARLILAEMPKGNPLHLFDSFEGLPEAWNIDNNHPKGRFACAMPQLNDARAVIHAGWFDKTVPEYALGLTKQMAFLNIDSDIYSSAATVLTELQDFIVPGTVIHFDEYHGYSTYMEHEYRAFAEFIERTGHGFEYLCRAIYQTGILITRK